MRGRKLFWALLLCAVTCAGCDQPRARPDSKPGVALLVFEREGGIAGFQDLLAVGQGGQYFLHLGGRLPMMGVFDQEKQAQLESWQAGFAAFTFRLEDNPGGVDNLVRQLTWTGQGRQSASRAQQRELLDWAAQLLSELSQAGS